MITDPIIVLRELVALVDSNTSRLAWDQAITGISAADPQGRASPTDTYRIRNLTNEVVMGLCETINDELIANGVPVDTFLNDATNAVYAYPKPPKPGDPFNKLFTPVGQLSMFQPAIKSKFKTIRVAEIQDVLGAMRDLDAKLLGATDPSQKVARELSEHLQSNLIPLVEQSLQSGRWLISRRVLESSSARLIVHGLALKSTGLDVTSAIVSIVATLCGFVPEIAVPAAVLSVVVATLGLPSKGVPNLDTGT